MIARTVLLVMMLTTAAVSIGQKTQIDRNTFYAAMASDKIELIKAQEEVVKSSSMPGKEAFEGALLMKRAGLVGKAGDKLSLFKSGHKLLDEAIKNDGDNPELRFLRLMIQENAPKILKYKSNISSDSQFIKQQFHQLNPEVQKAVIEYSKQAKTLKPSDFNQAPS
jgi:hypothetical protein